jgi:DNA-binding transcriptional ArsR family regulator
MTMEEDLQSRARSLSHPDVEELHLVDVLHALADPVRLEIVRKLYHVGGKVNCVSSVNSTPCLSKSTLSHHFRILREAGLVRSERQGVELLNCLRLTEIETRFPGVLTSILAAGCHASLVVETAQAS